MVPPEIDPVIGTLAGGAVGGGIGWADALHGNIKTPAVGMRSRTRPL
jgi:hypothetical protein